MSSYGQVYSSAIAATVPVGVVMQAASTGNGNGTPLPVSGFATAILHITGTSIDATINFEASVNNTDWTSILGLEVGTTSTATQATSSGDWVFSIPGFTSLRARVSDYVGGTINVDGYVSPLSGAGGIAGGDGGGDINLNQVGGNATDVGNGASGSGTLRVSLSSDSTGQLKLAAGTSTIGSIDDISGTISLPTGAATSAKQPALGFAGTAATDVITIQGIASMVAVKTDGSAVTQPVSGTFWQATQPVSGTFWQATQPVSDANLELAQNSTTSGQLGPLVQGAVSTSAPTYTNAKTSPLSLNTAGALRVDASGATVPVSISGNQATNIAQINGTTPAMGNGVSGSGVIRVSLASDSTGQIAQTASIMPAPTTMQNAATANGNGTSLNTVGFATAVLSITASPGMSGGTTVNFESSTDNSTWVAIAGMQIGTSTSATSTTAVGDWTFNVAGLSFLRARISSYSAGTISVKGHACVVSGGGGSSGGGGGSVTSNLTQINGTTVSHGNGTADNGCQRVTIASDSIISTTAAVRQTYAATTGNFTCATSCTDFWQIYGTGTNVVRVLKIYLLPWSLDTSTVTGTLNTILLRRRSTANSSGTAVSSTIIPLDPNNTAASAQPKHYTANPTLGTTLGSIVTLMTFTIALPFSVRIGANELPQITGKVCIFDADIFGQPITLRAATDGLVLNLNSATLAGTTPKMLVEVVWTEDNS